MFIKNSNTILALLYILGYKNENTSSSAFPHTLRSTHLETHQRYFYMGIGTKHMYLSLLYRYLHNMCMHTNKRWASITHIQTNICSSGQQNPFPLPGRFWVGIHENSKYLLCMGIANTFCLSSKKIHVSSWHSLFYESIPMV